MPRSRILLIGVLFLFQGSPRRAQAKNPPAPFEKLLITDGPLTGGFRLQENDLRVNWYFANLALLTIDREHPQVVQNYLDLYLKRVDRNTGTIQDLTDFKAMTLHRSDSDDSYAATFLSLASLHRSTPQGKIWWRKNKGSLKRIAKLVLLDTQKPSGLVPTFANGDRQNIAYLMDNCEVYRGLMDFSNALKADKDPDFKNYSEAAAKVSSGILTLYVIAEKRFKVSDIADADGFYPLHVCQVFPEVFGVPLGDAKQTEEIYASAWAFLDSPLDKHVERERWEDGVVSDGSFKGFPWMILGYAAAKRGESNLAKKQLVFFMNELNRPAPTPTFTAIQELGWAFRTKALLTKPKAGAAKKALKIEGR